MLLAIRKLFQPPGKKPLAKGGKTGKRKKLNEDIGEIGDILSTPMESGEGTGATGVEGAPPTEKESSEDKGAVKLEALLTQPAQLSSEEKSPDMLFTAPTETAEKEADKGGNEMMSSVFDREEEDEQGSMIKAIIVALPDVSVQELLDEARQVQALMSERAGDQKHTVDNTKGGSSLAK
jgi:hypothetical protein